MAKIADDPEGTRERILRVAEQLVLASGGKADISLRTIAQEANANVALISYYFGGKDGLLAEIYCRHARLIVQKRNHALSTLAASHSVEDVMTAWLRPMLPKDSVNPSPHARISKFIRTQHGHLYAKLFAELYELSNTRFVDALAALLPNLEREEIIWRLYAIAGAILTIVESDVQLSMASMAAQPVCSDAAQLFDYALAFSTAGFRAGPALRTPSQTDDTPIGCESTQPASA